MSRLIGFEIQFGPFAVAEWRGIAEGSIAPRRSEGYAPRCDSS